MSDGWYSLHDALSGVVGKLQGAAAEVWEKSEIKPAGQASWQAKRDPGVKRRSRR